MDWNWRREWRTFFLHGINILKEEPEALLQIAPIPKERHIQYFSEMNGTLTLWQRIVKYKLTKLLFKLRTVKIKILKRIHQTIIPFAVGAHHVIPGVHIKHGNRLRTVTNRQYCRLPEFYWNYCNNYSPLGKSVKLNKSANKHRPTQ